MNMQNPKLAQETAALKAAAAAPAVGILLALSFSHALNDLLQLLLPALYPLIKENLNLDFGQIGLITLCFQLTASILQPVVGLSTDRRPMPFSLAVGMASILVGLLLLAYAGSYAAILIAGVMIGAGSAIFHPEASRVARLASGGRHGFAQSVFQVGGSVGHAAGPLAAALVIVPFGQHSTAWFAILAFVGIVVLTWVGTWYRGHLAARRAAAPSTAPSPVSLLGRRRVMWTIAILLVLVFSKNVYQASLGSYYTFYLIHRFGVSVQSSQIYLFAFYAAGAFGTLAGGALGDRFGRIPVIWASILGVLPFSLALPYVGLPATVALSVIIGFVMASAFPAIIVYAQELLPGRVGAVAGLFFGFAFGMGGLGAAALGYLADATSIEFVFKLCGWLPLLGLVTIFVPKLERLKTAPVATGAAIR